MSVLVVAAHPDDEVLGCGGTIARHAADGDDVHIIVLGEGATSRGDASAGDADTKTLEDCGRKSATLLGAKSITFCSFPDNRFDSMNLLDVIRPIEQAVTKHSPGIVYTQFAGDLNIDHVVTFRATLTAVRPMANTPVRELYAYEVPSSTEWAFGSVGPAFAPTAFVDISPWLDHKVRAIEAYAPEMREYPHPRSAKALRAYSAMRGSSVGIEAAEAFVAIFTIR